MIRETTMISPTIAAAAGFDQCTRDYRPFLPNVKVPALVCFGRHDMFVPAPNAEFLTHSMPEARLVVFEDSGHVPFWEEPERFNTELDAFIRSIHR
jgi:pimeloyl-ACP methyl ester carboxylesterase